MRPYYEESGCTIYCGDSREIMPAVKKPDVVVADPPYAQTTLDWDVWQPGWMASIAANACWVFGTMRMFLERAEEFNGSGWKIAQDIVWEKQNGSSFHVDRFRRVHESAVMFYRGEWKQVYRSTQMTSDATARVTRRKEKPAHMGAIKGQSFVSYDGGPRQMRSVIKVRNCHGYAENETQKPLGIVRPLLLYSCPPGGLVLDPFMGSGTTLVVAKELGMSSIGIDVREQQCEVAANRLRQSVMQF